MVGIAFGCALAAASFCLGLLIVMAAANHPTGGSTAGLGLCATGVVVGIGVAIVSGILQLIG